MLMLTSNKHLNHKPRRIQFIAVHNVVSTSNENYHILPFFSHYRSSNDHLKNYVNQRDTVAKCIQTITFR